MNAPAPLSKAHSDHATRILQWYDHHRRALPWRSAHGVVAEPYHVWLSEIMLQQTTVATVTERYRRFVARWPTLGELATAPLDEVLAEWAGLGYYARARNLHKCAQIVANDFGGRFPDDEQALKQLPGIGDYTAAAIAAIAFDQPAVVVDGNVERVVARLFALKDPLPGAKARIKELAAHLTPKARPGDYAQAMMDLGATLCRPKTPACGQCPLATACAAHRDGVADSLPVRQRKKERPARIAKVYWLERDGVHGLEVWMRRRPETGLLGGMMEFPSSDWDEEAPAPGHSAEPAEAAWQQVERDVRHVFTHFSLTLVPYRARWTGGLNGPGDWVPVRAFDTIAMPSVMRKVAEACLVEGRS